MLFDYGLLQGLLAEMRLFTNLLHPSKYLTLIYEHNFLLRTIDHGWYSIIVTILYYFFFPILVRRSYILGYMTSRNRNASTGTFLRGFRTEAWIIHPFGGIRWLYYSFPADFNVFREGRGFLLRANNEEFVEGRYRGRDALCVIAKRNLFTVQSWCTFLALRITTYYSPACTCLISISLLD